MVNSTEKKNVIKEVSKITFFFPQCESLFRDAKFVFAKQMQCSVISNSRSSMEVR